MPRPWWPTEAASAVRIALTCVAAIYLAMLLELDRRRRAKASQADELEGLSGEAGGAHLSARVNTSALHGDPRR
jgi:hypothetical protein